MERGRDTLAPIFPLPPIPDRGTGPVATAADRANLFPVPSARLFSSLQSEGLERYLAEVRALPSLSEQEEGEVFQAATAGDQSARERIVMAHLGLVARIAFQYAGYGLPMADLVSEGNLGLLRAAELFDPKFGVAFSTYASVWIKQRMHRAITAQAHAVRIPVWRSQRLRKLDRLHAELNAELGRDARHADLAERLGVAEDDVERMSQDRLTVDTLDDVLESALAADLPHPAQQLTREELLEEVAACLAGLDDTELQIVARKFGLLDEAPESYREMASDFGRSREWIRRIGEGAVAKLRQSLSTVGALPRSLVAARRRKAQERLRRLSSKAAAPARMSVFQMVLMQWLEPLIAIL
jgi:RNA polymerase primary sigma factor